MDTAYLALVTMIGLFGVIKLACHLEQGMSKYRMGIGNTFLKTGLEV